MDPVAHTLVGAMLAETGLKKTTKLATAALVLGANAPDIDIVAAFGGGDASLYWRRGVTHGALAMLVLPAAVTGTLVAWDRLVRRRMSPGAEPARAGPLFWLSLLAVLTHPVLDWLNTYGVRLLMPFTSTWYYGDALFIVDPWLWLLAAAGVVLARTRGPLSVAGFAVLGCAATALVTLTGLVTVAAQVVWGLGIVAIAALRLSGWDERRVQRLATGCAIALALYAGASVALSRAAVADARAWLARQGIAADELAAVALPADPFTRGVIARAGDTYHFVERAWLRDPALRFDGPPQQVGPRGAAVEAALGARELRGLRVWLRFPSFEVREHARGYTVRIRDVRYARRGSGLGTAEVELDRALRPRSVRR